MLVILKNDWKRLMEEKLYVFVSIELVNTIAATTAHIVSPIEMNKYNFSSISLFQSFLNITNICNPLF